MADGRQNVLPPRSGRTTGEIVRANVFTRINGLLAVLLVLVLSTGSWINGTFGFLIIFNSIIGIIQELRAKRTLDNLAVVGEARPSVRRDGQSVVISRESLVLDDLVEIGPGDQVVVDGEVVAADYLELDESLLTGENDPVPKAPADQVMSGSFIVSGTGVYRATKVGAQAYAAQLAAEAAKFSLTRSELMGGINKILKLITFLLVPVAIATIYTQWQYAHDWRRAVLRMAGALIPMVPEGLVLLTSIAFALGVIRLGQRKCLVNELPAIEGLARVDVVCADKTGTLTAAGMDLDAVRSVGPLSEAELRVTLANLFAADPRPNASLQAIGDVVGSPDEPWPVLARAPFTSAKKWSGVTFAGAGNWVLGAADVLVPDTAVDAEAQQIAGTGLRVLLLGQTDTPVDDPDAPGDVRPQGLVVLAQRLRPDARQTLEYFAEQDVEIKVISGDNAESVAAVTRSLGLAGSAVDARKIPVEAGTDLTAALEKHTVFGRVTPQQKRAMVTSLQSAGHTVAMTGDGVNDVLALKDADLGVAMGSGSAASRGVAQIVLLDDKFATLPHVVAEGRRVIGNIERVANLFLTKTIYSVLLAVLVVIAQVPFPFQPIHISVTGWFTIGIPAFLLSLAPNNERAQPGFVERVMRLALPSGVIVGTAAFVTYMLTRPADPDGQVAIQSSTAALTTLIISATWLLCVVARPLRLWKVGLILGSVAAYLAIFLFPYTRPLLQLDISNTSMMMTGFLVGGIGAALVEIAWWVTGAIYGSRRRVWHLDDEDAPVQVGAGRAASRRQGPSSGRDPELALPGEVGTGGTLPGVAGERRPEQGVEGE